MKKSIVTIEYCDECMYLKPALEAAQALLETYTEKIASLTLIPGHDGVFRVCADESLVIQMGDEGLPNAAQVIAAVQNYLQRTGAG